MLEPSVKAHFTTQVGQNILERPTITKIMHGCLSGDLPWLQRDFGIRVTNVFDTQEFERSFVNNKELQLSLASFWAKYCEGLAPLTLAEKKQF